MTGGVSHVVLAFLLSFGSGSAAGEEAGGRDGNYLLARCSQAIALLDGKSEGWEQLTKATECTAYLDGLVEMNEAYRKVFESSPAIFCAPEGITGNQAARVVDKYLRDHPERLHESALALSIYSFQEAFPCTQAKRPPKKGGKP
jgi:hypothetical protein